MFVPSVNNKSSKITLTNIKKIAMLIMLLVDNLKMRKQLSGRAASCKVRRKRNYRFPLHEVYWTRQLCWVFCICLVFARYLWYDMGYGLIKLGYLLP